MLAATTCHKKNPAACPVETNEYTFTTHAAVDTIPSPGLPIIVAEKVGGNRLVFSYLWTREECPEVQDGFSGALLLFEADPAVTHFKYYSDSLPAIHCYYRHFCAEGCVSSAYIPVGGTIEGTKINNQKWAVSIDLKTSGSTDLKVSTNFTAAN